MSTFGTFLTDGQEERRHRQKLGLNQKFLRGSYKHFPKKVKPMVNVNANPVVIYVNSKHQKQEEFNFRKTMKYQSFSQIVPTVGLNNLVFYDCCNEETVKPLERCLDDSISNLFTPSAATETHQESEFSRSQEVVDVGVDRDLFAGAANKSLEWMGGMDVNFDEFDLVPQTYRTQMHDSIYNFTLTNARLDFASSFVSSYSLFEMDLNSRHFDSVPSSDIPSFEVNLDEPIQLKNDADRLEGGIFEVNLNRQDSLNLSGLTGIDSINGNEFRTELNSQDWNTKSVTCPSVNESMGKFGVSSCDMSLEIMVKPGSYADFKPSITSTPRSRTKRPNAARHELSDLSRLMNMLDEGSFLNQRVGEAERNFSFIDSLDDFNDQFLF